MNHHLNPEGLTQNPAFTQVVVVESPAKFVYVGGQNAVTRDGQIAGDTISEQAEQTLSNVKTAVEAVGGTIRDIVKWTIYLVDGQPIQDAFAAFGAFWGRQPNPPAISVVIVAGLANPRFLIEIEALAAI